MHSEDVEWASEDQDDWWLDVLVIRGSFEGFDRINKI